MPQQEQAAREWCAGRGYTLSRIFADVARSGRSTASRAEFLAMVDYLLDGSPERGLIIYEFSRFSRDIDDLNFYLADLRRSGIVVHSLHDDIPAGLEGRLFESIIAYKNAKYIQDLARNVRRGLAYTRAQYHAWQASIPPAGYRKVQRTIGHKRDGAPRILSVLEPDPATAPLVRLAFEMRLAGRSMREIHAATGLYSYGPLYVRMLRNPIYIGVHDGIENFCEPIVDRETWQAVQDRARLHPRREMSFYLLSGLARCAACGRSLRGHSGISKGRRFHYYRCMSVDSFAACEAPLIPAPALERLVIERAREHLSDPAIVEDVVAETQRIAAREQETGGLELAPARAELEAAQANVRRLVAAIRAAGHSAALLADLAEQEKRAQAAQDRLVAIERALRARLSKLPSAEQVRAGYARLLAGLETADRRELQLLLRSFVAEVRAGRTGKEIQGEVDFITPLGERATRRL